LKDSHLTSHASGKYIFWVELNRFYTHPHELPYVVIRDGIVLDADDDARARGVQSGITLRQARALLKDGEFHTWRKEEYEAHSRAWLDACVPFSGVIQPVDQHCAWIDLSLHPAPIDVAEQLIRALVKKSGRKASFGAGPSRWIAQLAARQDDCGLAVRDPKAFLAPLPTKLLLPIAPEHRERLCFLGYHTIGSVSSLPLDVLQAQFGQEALRIRSAANGLLSEPVAALYPPSSVAESLIFDGPAESLETIHRACAKLARRVGRRLLARNAQSGKLHLTLEFEGGERKRLNRIFTKPLRCPKSVLTAIRLLIDPALNAPLCAIRLFLADLVPEQQYQPTLIDSKVQPDVRRVGEAVRHVHAVYGGQAVQLGKELLLPRRQRVLQEWKHATGWR
jgi:DNA polymerase-4